MLRTARSLPPTGLSTPGFDPARLQAEPPACYRASWQLPGRDSHPQAATSLCRIRSSQSTTPNTGRTPFAAVNLPGRRFPVVVRLCGVHLLGSGLVGVLVSDSVELLAVELGESDAVGLVGDDEVEDGPYEGEAAVLAGEPADHLGAAFDLAERPFEQVCAAPPAAVPGGVAQVDDERVEVVGEAFRGGGVAGTFELVDQRLELLLGVASVDGRIERLPVRLADPFAFALGHLRVEVARGARSSVGGPRPASTARSPRSGRG